MFALLGPHIQVASAVCEHSWMPGSVIGIVALHQDLDFDLTCSGAALVMQICHLEGEFFLSWTSPGCVCKHAD